MIELRPFWNYYGGKWRAAPRYPAPVHDTIIEPFAGAAGYSTRYASRRVILVDSDPIIAGLWRYLIAASPEEILALPDLEAGQSVDDLEVCQEAGWLIGFWLNSATSHPCKTPSSWMRKQGTWKTGTSQLFWGPRVRERIAWQVTRIRHWEIIEGDYTAAPDLEATDFVDSPYQRAGKHYRYGSDALDFAALGTWCRGRRGQVIVCENVGADWLPFEPFARIKAATVASGPKTSAEAIWMQPAPLRLFA